MNKNIVDAVNEFNGEWPFGMCNSIIYGNQGQGFDSFHQFDHIYSPNSNWSYICSRNQFNAEVTSLSHHAGVELFKEYLAADKTPANKENTKVDYTSEEFWKDAPEGHNYAVINNKVHDSISFYNHPPKYEYSVKFDNDHTMICFDDGGDQYNTCSFHVAERPQPKPEKPVYTQAMADNGELPSVGMECLFKGKLYEILVLNDFQACVKDVKSVDGYMSTVCLPDIKPIDARTSKEKLFDQINSVPRIYIADAEKLVEQIVNGELCGVTFKGEE